MTTTAMPCKKIKGTRSKPAPRLPKCRLQKTMRLLLPQNAPQRANAAIYAPQSNAGKDIKTQWKEARALRTHKKARTQNAHK